MPLVSQTFDQLLDFTRTTAATFVGSNGLVQLTPASVNLLTFTQQFDNAVWSKNAATVTANSTVAPDGTSTADTLVETTATSTHRAKQSVSTVAAGVITTSVYAKAAGRSRIVVTNESSVANDGAFAVFNLLTGVVDAPPTTYGSGFSAVSASIESVGNGWFRCSVTANYTGTNRAISCNLDNATSGAASQTYTGDGTSGLFLWGAQLEAVPDANLVLGSELATNGDFATDTAWTKGTGWTIGSGVATKTAGTAAALSQNMGLVNGRTYRITVTLTSTAGNLIIRLNDVTPNMATLSTSGTYTLYIAANGAAANGFAYFNGDAAFAGSVDNISVKQITGTVGMPSTYTRNNGGVFPPRFDYDPVTLAPKGILIEEQRTNLVTYSEQFDNAVWAKNAGGTASIPTVTPNFATAPDGTATADRVQMTLNGGTTASDAANVNQSAAYPAGSVTLTIWMRSNTGSNQTVLLVSGGAQITDSIKTVTPTWQRFSVTQTLTAGSSSSGLRLRGTFTGDTADILVWGAQLEAGAFATSYIPTVASQVTRAPDQTSIVAPNFAPWFNQSEGTFVTQVSLLDISSGHLLTAFQGYSDLMRIRPLSSIPTANITVGGVSQFDSASQGSLGAITTNEIFSSALAYKQNDTSFAAKGVSVPTDTSVNLVSAPSRLAIGSLDNSGSGNMNGHIRSVRYYPVRLSNAQLQALTA